MNKHPSSGSLLFAMVSLFFFFMQAAHAAIYTGVVTDKENNNNPIPGVLVSAGHSIYRTITDAQGRFSFEAPDDAIKTQYAIQKPQLKRNVIWSTRRHSIDLEHSHDITAVAIYRLNGARQFYCHTLKTDRHISIPQLPTGVYLLSFSLVNNRSFSWKLLSTQRSGDITIPIPCLQQQYSSASASASGMPLIFRHDAYFPVDRTVQPAETLSIAMKQDKRAFVFDETKIHTYRFTLSVEDSLSMERNARDEEFTPAEFYFDDTLFGKVGLRYKGSDAYSMPRCFDSIGNRSDYADCKNVSLKIKFNEYNDTARFFALKKLNLHAMSYDGSKLREMIAYEAFREMGIYTCRTAFVKVYINGVFRGLFTAVEEIDGRFTKARWPDYGDGNLYKEVWPFAASKYYYIKALVTNNDSNDTPDAKIMVNFYKAIKAATPETFLSTVSPYFDFDYWLNYIVVDRAIHNTDGIMAWYTDGSWVGNHNYYFYEEENAGGKLWLIPWDLNETFSPVDWFTDRCDVPEWNVVPENCDPVMVWGGSLVRPPNCDKLTGLTAVTMWDKFRSAGAFFLSTSFNAQRMKAKIDTLAALIAPVMENEPSITKKSWEAKVASIRSTMDVLHKGFDDYINNRISIIDTSGFFTPFPADSGFLTSRINNFEFGAGASIAPWCTTEISAGSEITLTIDTVAPLWGKASINARFTFNPFDTTKTYSEWANIALHLAAASDFREIDSIQICLQGDASRDCYIYLDSDAYTGPDGSDEKYGWTLVVTKKSKQFTLAMADASYPEWVNSDTPDLLDSVTASVSGISICPRPQFDDRGHLKVVPDSGFIKIDNVKFIYNPNRTIN